MKREREKAPLGSGEGNTKPPLKKRCTASKKWCFTLNNPDGSMAPLLEEMFKNKKCKYVFQEETGEEGTPHLQGYVEFESKVRPIECIGIKQIHWEKTRDDKASIKYCCKSDTRTGNVYTNIILPREVKDPLQDKILYTWQQEIIDLVKTEPDDRSIHWYWSAEGCKGKTTLAKHLVINYGALFLTGKGRDILCGIALAKEKNLLGNVMVFHYTRTVEDYVSYEALEQAKDGIFFSGKYESGMVIYPPPHVIVFANFEPKLDKLSKDRWVIKNID